MHPPILYTRTHTEVHTTARKHKHTHKNNASLITWGGEAFANLLPYQ